MVQSYPSKEVLIIKSLEAFEKAANGRATKIIIPSEIQGLAGLASALTATARNRCGRNPSGQRSESCQESFCQMSKVRLINLEQGLPTVEKAGDAADEKCIWPLPRCPGAKPLS